jgi:hypothetical protein
MCTGAKKEVRPQIPGIEEKPEAEPELVKMSTTNQLDCCDPDCGPSSCGR